MQKLKFKKGGKTYLVPITIEPCEEGGYFSFSPVLQGAHAEGSTYAEVVERMEDVVRQHIALRLERGEFVPSLEITEEATSNIPLAARM